MRRFHLALCTLALVACVVPTQRAGAIQKSIEKKGATYTVKLEYPVIAGASDAFNKQLADAALTHLEQVEDDPIPFDEYARNMAAESAGEQWVLESKMTVAHQSRTILTTLCKTYTNTGGAHPNTFHYYEVYDLISGRRLELSDLLEDGKLDAIRALALAPNNDGFPNEPTIGLLKNHLVFRYDPDARLVPGIEIPYGKLKGILKPQYLPWSTDTTLSVAPRHTAFMQITQLKDLGIVTDQLAQSRDFYVAHLGFEPVFVSDWYIHLKNGAVEIGLMAAKPEMPATPANGVWLSLGVADVDAEYARLKAAGANVDAEPKDQPWGERCFFVRDPNGLGVNLSTSIPVNEEFMRSENQLAHASS